jgi:hypothetical protein
VTKLALAREVLGTYARAWLLLRRRPLAEALTMLREPRPGAAKEDPRRLARAVTRTLRVLPSDSRCLISSATLSGLLAHRDMDHVVVLGVRPGETFTAHAWVEWQGVPLLSPGDFERLVEV